MREEYSISRAIMETLEKGAPVSGLEAEFHYSELRSRQKAAPHSPLAGLMAGGPPSVHVPLDLGLERRGVSAGGSGAALIGEEKQIISPLLT